MKIEHVFINFPNLYLILIWLINKIGLRFYLKYDFIQIIYYDHFKIKHIYVYLRVDALPFIALYYLHNSLLFLYSIKTRRNSFHSFQKTLYHSQFIKNNKNHKQPMVLESLFHK